MEQGNTETRERVAHTKSSIWPVGKPMRKKDGSLLIVTATTKVRKIYDGLSFGYPINEGWSYTATFRPATDAEFKAAAITNLRRELESLTAEADDYRNQPALIAQRQAIRAKIEALENAK